MKWPQGLMRDAGNGKGKSGPSEIARGGAKKGFSFWFDQV